MNSPVSSSWDKVFDRPDYVYGVAPNVFLASQKHRLKPGWQALALADGEGRNGVWMAEQGLDVLSLDGSSVAQEKAKKLAAERGVQPSFELADLSTWAFPVEAFDLIAAIFIQFAGPELREQHFKGIVQALKPGGLLLLTGYRVEQLQYGTGGPPVESHLYTEDMLREAFSALEILELNSHDSEMNEGAKHSGRSALIDLVARKPL